VQEQRAVAADAEAAGLGADMGVPPVGRLDVVVAEAAQRVVPHRAGGRQQPDGEARALVQPLDGDLG
jgi:hypothetical protein